jgi:uncharacterized protein (TIGR02246 family)
VPEPAEEIARRIVAQLQTAWNAANGAVYAEPFAADADFVDIRGVHHGGRQAIAQGHQAIFDTIYQGSRVDYDLVAARPLTAEVILARVRAHLNAPTGPLAGQHSSTLTLVLLRSGEEWKIAAFHNTLVAPSSQG